jgi:hypothetical protein
MSSDSGGQKGKDEKFGRTSWDVVAALLGNRVSLAIVTLVVIGAIVLAARGTLQLGYSKEGWKFCLPCDPPLPPASAGGAASAVPPASEAEPASAASPPPAAAPSPATPPTSAQQQTAPSPPAPLLDALLNVPIHTSLHDAKQAVSSLQTKAYSNGRYYVSYQQDLFGLKDVWVIEDLSDDDITENAMIIRQVTYERGSGAWYGDQLDHAAGEKKYVDDACFGRDYDTIIGSLSDEFGTPKNLAPTYQDTSKQVSPSFWVDNRRFCTTELDKCTVTATQRQQRTIFNKKFPGTITFTATLTEASREARAERTWGAESFAGCHWRISINPN